MTPPTYTETSEALRVITDPTRGDRRLLELCDGDTDRAGFLIAYTALHALIEVAL